MFETQLKRFGVAAEAPPKLSAQLLSELRTVIQGASTIVSMHPDQATEAIVDCALALGKPFAAVLCCVFPHSFPERFIVEDANRSGHRVVSYEQFLEYLQWKPDQSGLLKASRVYLPCVGKNCAIHSQTERVALTGTKTVYAKHW